MDHLWTPWRYRYLTAQPRPRAECVFCAIGCPSDHAAQGAVNDEENLIVYRGLHNFVVLNRFPYTSGHLMVIPYAHAALLSEITAAAAGELMELARLTERHLRAVYRPDGLNLGMNIGESAGAGVAGHIHLHALPRWHGDVNFMTTVAETRILPEDLAVTWRRLREAFTSG